MNNFALPSSNRPDPYIQDGDIAYVYERGTFRAVRSDHHSGGGAFQFNWLDTGHVGCCGFGSPMLLSQNDMSWFKAMAEKYGEGDYYSNVRFGARQGNMEMNYFIMWLEYMHTYLVKMMREAELSSWEDPHDIEIVCPKDFINAAKRVQLYTGE